jgi:hypothetical protein
MIDLSSLPYDGGSCRPVWRRAASKAHESNVPSVPGPMHVHFGVHLHGWEVNCEPTMLSSYFL